MNLEKKETIIPVEQEKIETNKIAQEAVQKGKEETAEIGDVLVGEKVNKEEKKVQEEGMMSKLRSRLSSMFEGKKLSNEEALNVIRNHPAKRQQYSGLDENQKSKYVEAVASNPSIKYWKWDNVKNKFVTSGNFSVASGEGTSGK